MIRNAPVDEWIEAAKDEPLGNHERALFAHKSLTNLFSEISGKKHQSLASKYLHFHAKEKFYIFDSRARVTLRTLGNLPKTEKLCEAENDKLGNMLGRKLTPRELDKILLAYELKNQ